MRLVKNILAVVLLASVCSFAAQAAMTVDELHVGGSVDVRLICNPDSAGHVVYNSQTAIDVKRAGNALYYGIDPRSMSSSIYECMVDNDPLGGSEVPTCMEGLWLVGSRIDLAGAEIELISKPDRERVLERLLAPVRDTYDYVIIDCSPSLGLITVNALTASDSVIIPVQAEYFALEGISKLLNTIRIIKSRLNPSLEIEGFLLTMYDARLRLANQIYEELKGHFGDMVFNTVIPRNIRLSEAPSHGLPALLYDSESRGATSHILLAKELINKHSRHHQARAAQA